MWPGLRSMKTPRSAKVRYVHVPTAAVGTLASAQCFQMTRVLLLALAVLGPASAQISDFAMTGTRKRGTA
jgi:hypothetical protein